MRRSLDHNFGCQSVRERDVLNQPVELIVGSGRIGAPNSPRAANSEHGVPTLPIAPHEGAVEACVGKGEDIVQVEAHQWTFTGQ